MIRRITAGLVGFGLALYSSSCGEGLDPLPLGCDDLGVDAAAQKTEAFLRAADRFTVEAATLQGDLEGVCQAMADDLGIEVPAPMAGQAQVEATCGAVVAEVDATYASLAAGVSVALTVEPARCYVDARATVDCVAMCDANFEATSDLMCSGGEIRGQCYVEGSASCGAECQGTCTGTCSGTCSGACDGTCSAVDGAGNCIGQCEGTCMGSCSGSCTGSCSGSCVAEVTGACTGSCEGSCDVEFVEPECTGGVEVMADADCEAACEAEASLEATCTRPSVEVVVTGVDPASDERLAVLVRTLQRNWSDFVAIRTRIEASATAGAAFAESATDLAEASGELGFRAAACVAGTVTAVADAAASVQVSVEVTVEVSGSVSAGA